jgi:hypothetical protein
MRDHRRHTFSNGRDLAIRDWVHDAQSAIALIDYQQT